MCLFTARCGRWHFRRLPNYAPTDTRGGLAIFIELSNVQRRRVVTQAELLLLHLPASYVQLLENPGDGKAWALRQLLVYSSNTTDIVGGGSFRIRPQGSTNDLIPETQSAELLAAFGDQTIAIHQPLVHRLDSGRAIQLQATGEIYSGDTGVELIIFADKVFL